ncbi:hypothetical protein [Fervidicoccus fontis]|uniref:Uncharacterized protein n=1 Tax=Fervidicoccus fontis (strain DSM 19380 / JCM 18336 / VKM B-2539 / Kam940) TaxID=1163730 RepID=H9ZZF5_FERFK|nr:hypothetical protein [Fervidicoccus fontis]AFH42112.1 hypothetical protein FFONT_0120 [Fervidicoccus fontis Kam940]
MIDFSGSKDAQGLSEKDKWIQKMIKSAKKHHKLCPYFDKKTQKCFIRLGKTCDRDGKFDMCPTFMEFLSSKYDEYVSKNKPLPVDFMDIVL